MICFILNMKTLFNKLLICLIILNIFIIESSCTVSYEMIINYLNNGQYDLIEQVLQSNNALTNKNEIVMKLTNELTSRIDKLNEIENKYMNVKNNVITITPAVKWAENSRYIYLQIQLKHTNSQSEQPLCMHLDLDNFELLTDSNYIHFSGYCFNNNSNNIKFELSLSLTSNLNKLKSQSHNITPNAKGVYTVLLYKSENVYWGSLLKNTNSSNIDIIKIDESVFDIIN